MPQDKFLPLSEVSLIPSRWTSLVEKFPKLTTTTRSFVDLFQTSAWSITTLPRTLTLSLRTKERLGSLCSVTKYVPIIFLSASPSRTRPTKQSWPRSSLLLQFEQEGRSFYPGDDPYFEAGDFHAWATTDLEWWVGGRKKQTERRVASNWPLISFV